MQSIKKFVDQQEVVVKYNETIKIVYFSDTKLTFINSTRKSKIEYFQKQFCYMPNIDCLDNFILNSRLKSIECRLEFMIKKHNKNVNQVKLNKVKFQENKLF